MSYLYDMGLRSAICNGCSYLEYKWKLGDKFLVLNDGWINVYELDAEPSPGQGEPVEHDGRSIKHRSGFMSIGHSDECWGFKIPDYPHVPTARYDPDRNWKTADGHIILIEELETGHLINILKLIKSEGGNHPGLKSLRSEAKKREIILTTGKPSTVDKLIFPEGPVQRIKELLA